MVRLVGIGAAIAAIVAVFGANAPALAATRVPKFGCDIAPAAVKLSTPAAELRVNLDRLLAEHAFLTIEQMRSGLVGSPDFAAAAAAVESNSTDIANAIGSIYGHAAVDPFGEIWRSHIGYLVDYSIALGKGDAAGQEAAKAGLAIYRLNLHKFLADANPGVDLRGISEALDMHTAQLLEFIDTEHSGDHAAAYAIEREAYPHMFNIGDALAKVVANRFSKQFSGLDTAYSPAGTLRVTLDRLLAEHYFLAAEAMRSGVSGSADFDAGKAAIAANSAELQGVVGAAYGAKAAAGFRTLWDGHITAYLAYIDAARANDAAGKAAATASVNVYAGQLAGFFAGANPYLDAGALTTLFQQHAGHLIGQVDAFSSADYAGTYQLVRTGYSHMFMAGEALALGIATQKPKQFPDSARLPDTATVDAPASGARAFLDLGSPLAAVLAFGVLFGLSMLAVGRRRGG